MLGTTKRGIKSDALSNIGKHRYEPKHRKKIAKHRCIDVFLHH